MYSSAWIAAVVITLQSLTSPFGDWEVKGQDTGQGSSWGSLHFGPCHLAVSSCGRERERE